MATRRHGRLDAFYGTAPSTLTTTGAPNALSRKINVGQDVDQVTFYISVAGATTINLLVAHSGGLTADGDEPDASSPPADAFFYPLYYTGTLQQVVFAGVGTRALIIPDWSATWIALQSTATTTAIAGFEAASS